MSVLPMFPPEFGIVHIERGSEVGIGEQRFPIGTVAQITGVETSRDAHRRLGRR